MARKISVVIPVYNDLEGLNKLMVSLTDQTINHELFEVIVVNNGDVDFEFDPNQYPKLRINIVHESKPGSYAARNRGIKEAENEIIGFTDSDMVPDIKWLECAYEFFLNDRERNIGILTGPVPLFFKNPEKLSIAEVYEKYTGFDFKGYAKEGACGAGNWFSYKDVLKEFGYFREDLKSNGDTELSLKISKKYEIKYVPFLINRHPARYNLFDLSFRYCRILGGTYQRNYSQNHLGFFKHTVKFILRRYRFFLKKFFTVNLKESSAIFIACNVINYTVLKEFFVLINGGETKR